jgi:hypothetical protein
VSVVDSEKKRSDEYWMGVRDALRMVDSFSKWARRNESRAKNLDDFIHDGLVAAAKRCESCLKDDLGLTFAEDEKPTDEGTDVERVPSGYEMDSAPRDYSESEEPTFEVSPEDMFPGASEVPIESESDTISIDTVGRLEEEEMEDISIDGPSREFVSDFELVEPTDLTVEQPDTAPTDEVTSKEEEEEPSDTKQKPSFTWADYEKAVTPDKEDPELVEEDVELPPSVEMESVETSIPSDEPEAISELGDIPEPPSIPTDEFEDSPVDEEDIDSIEKPEPITEPPPPPPPPDSDEDEDERRRRARRLFFGD